MDQKSDEEAVREQLLKISYEMKRGKTRTDRTSTHTEVNTDTARFCTVAIATSPTRRTITTSKTMFFTS